MRNVVVIATVLLMLHFVSYDALARPDQMTKTTEEPKVTEQSAAMTGNMTESEDEDDSVESGEDEPEDLDSGEGVKTAVDSKTALPCPSRPTEITDLESQCVAEYKAMKKAKCNTTEEEKMKKMNTMESLENGSHASHMGKGEVPVADDMVSAEGRVNLTRTNKHQRKRSCHYYQCILKKLDVLDDTTMLPNEDMFKMWVANNITEDGEKLRLQERVTVCFIELRELGLFSTDNSKTEASGDASNVKKGKTSCDAALKLLKCLSKQDSECPAFKFP
ncbi:hypothetical protein B7P43_G05535 [Cryptotermes secundus]|uniref:Uncharacterized protein n=1 Tax=Cryptotermes secundus TaxID=105785 RepID=A0A2J7RN87_9NEOP|nr:uncharacterized protein LOC111868731 [Cryptotermes secundus]PNF42288.1 hypothetical protein B7P43_G05535 [Cryptotermes secundus]